MIGTSDQCKPAGLAGLFAIVCCVFAAIPASQSRAAPLDPLEDALIRYATFDYPAALRMLRPHAENGDAVAQEIVGFMYLRAEGTAPDPVIAIEWIKRAAAAG